MFTAPILADLRSGVIHSPLRRFSRSATHRLELFSGTDFHPTPLGNIAQYGEPAVSPDGTQVAFCARDREHGVDNMDVWVVDLATRFRRRVTFDEAVDVLPVWSPDGRELLFRSNRSGSSNLYRKRLGADHAEKLVLASPERKDPTDWSSDGRTILFTTTSVRDPPQPASVVLSWQPNR